MRESYDFGGRKFEIGQQISVVDEGRLLPNCKILDINEIQHALKIVNCDATFKKEDDGFDGFEVFWIYLRNVRIED